jgi:hypothetical protein
MSSDEEIQWHHKPDGLLLAVSGPSTQLHFDRLNVRFREKQTFGRSETAYASRIDLFEANASGYRRNSANHAPATKLKRRARSFSGPSL